MILEHLPLILEDEWLTAQEGARKAKLSMAGWWRGVAAGRLPALVYPLPRAPRWRLSELLAALEATRMLPREAKLARREARNVGGNAAPDVIYSPDQAPPPAARGPKKRRRTPVSDRDGPP